MGSKAVLAPSFAHICGNRYREAVPTHGVREDDVEAQEFAARRRGQLFGHLGLTDASQVGPHRNF